MASTRSYQNSARIPVKREYNPFKYSSEMKAIGCWQKVTRERREEERQEQLRKEKEENRKEAELVYKLWLKHKFHPQAEKPKKKKTLKKAEKKSEEEATPPAATSLNTLKKTKSTVSFAEGEALTQERIIVYEPDDGIGEQSRRKIKTFMYTEDEKELLAKQQCKKEQRIKQAELALEAEKAAARKQAQERWDCWLAQKNCELAEKKKQLKELAEEAARCARDPKKAKKAYNEWQKLQLRQGRDRQLEAYHDRIKQQMQQLHKDNEFCENAFECWVHRKRKEKLANDKDEALRRKLSNKMQSNQRKYNKQLALLTIIDNMKYIETD